MSESLVRPWWQRWLAILGLVVLFPVLLTIPFWFALRGYRRWQRGGRIGFFMPLLWILGGLLVAGLTIGLVTLPLSK